MIKDAHFSECRKYRYWLKRQWDESRPMAMCIGLNPSTANESDNDTTITNLVRLLDTFGYGGFYMCNLFALISSNPEDLRSCPDPVKDNDLHLQAIRTKVTDVIFCWGAFKQAQYRIKSVVERFPGALCLGKTPKGQPLHPLAATIWQRSKCFLQPYNSVKQPA